MFDIGDRISVTNIAEAYNVLWENGTDDVWDFDRLVATHSGTGGLECYFVNKIVRSNNNARTIGGHSASGIVISSSGCGVTLAHEIGHAFGMDDIYRERPEDDGAVLQGYACYWWNGEDWNGGCCGHSRAGTRYYSGVKQESLILRMLMDGYKINATSGVDITYGSVYGLDITGNTGLQDTGFFGNSGHVDNPAN